MKLHIYCGAMGFLAGWSFGLPGVLAAVLIVIGANVIEDRCGKQ